jgi:hypothetical protein
MVSVDKFQKGKLKTYREKVVASTLNFILGLSELHKIPSVTRSSKVGGWGVGVETLVW